MDEETSRPHRQLVRSYLSLRKSVGLLGTALPFVLILGGLVLWGALEPSISAYYHTPLRDLFVGTLCAIAVFLWSYRGYEPRDNRAGNLASAFALGVAFFPVATPSATAAEQVLGWLHVFSAAGFFATLAYFSLFLFRLSDKATPTRQKLWRNRIYAVSGYVIVACMIGIVIVNIAPVREALRDVRPVLWLEAAAILAFGVSWLTKGEAILGDEDEEQALAQPRVAPRIPRGRKGGS